MQSKLMDLANRRRFITWCLQHFQKEKLG